MSVESPAHDRRSPLHPALSMRQGYAILEESASVRNLMRASINAIRTMGYVRLDGDPAFAVGSLGVEKLMKLILGCASIADSGAWPTERKLQRWGHDIEKLYRRVAALVDDGVGRTTAKGYSAGLADRVAKSDILPLVFATFSRYGKEGRFHHLSILATDQPGELDEPMEYWERVEFHVRQTRAELGELPVGDNVALDAYEKAIHGIVADELDVWWFCMHRLAVQGCFGDLAKRVGFEIWEPGRATPGAVSMKR